MRASEQDLGQVQMILAHDAVFPWISEDGDEELRGSIAERLFHSAAVWILLPSPGVCFVIRWLGRILAEVHTAALPDYRGRPALDAARAALAWLWHESPLQALISWVPVTNRAALWFSLRMGFQKVGLVPRAFVMQGKATDAWLVCINRPIDINSKTRR